MADGAVGRAVLRGLLRQARLWAADAAAKSPGGGRGEHPATARLAVSPPLDLTAWRVGAHGLALAGDAYHEAAAAAVLPAGVSPPPGGAWADGPALRRWILAAARAGEGKPTLLDAGLAGLRALQGQRALERCSSTQTTRCIRVDATSAVVGPLPSAGRGGGGSGGSGEGLVLDFGGDGGTAASSSSDERFLFTYRLRISHVGGAGDGKVRLATRAWTIRDGRGRLHAAVPPGSPGLVGATPTLAPGDVFEYYSATDMPGGLGVMKGSIGCVRLEGGGGGGEAASSSSFDAAVAPFALRADPLGVGKGRGVRR